MNTEDSRKILPDDFFTKPMPHKTEIEPKEDMIPMKWKRYRLKNKIKKILFKNKK